VKRERDVRSLAEFKAPFKHRDDLGEVPFVEVKRASTGHMSRYG
jgi:hypothetical protein